jgi:hypothetical protein
VQNNLLVSGLGVIICQVSCITLALKYKKIIIVGGGSGSTFCKNITSKEVAYIQQILLTETATPASQIRKAFRVIVVCGE